MDDSKLIRRLTRERDEALEEVLQLRRALGLRGQGGWEPHPKLRLTHTEAKLLRMLYTRPVVTHDEMYVALYGVDGDRVAKAIDVHLSKMRAKLRPWGVDIESLGWRSQRWALNEGACERLDSIKDTPCSKQAGRDIIELSTSTLRGRGPRGRQKGWRAGRSTTSG